MISGEALVDEIDLIIHTLVSDSEVSLLRLGYLEETIDNPFVEPSAKGLSIELVIFAVNMSILDSLSLSTVRCMESTKDYSRESPKSLPNALRLLRLFIDENYEFISVKTPLLHTSEKIHLHIQILRQPKMIARFWQLYELVVSISSGQLMSSIRIHRDENIAHLLSGQSRSRRKMQADPAKISFGELKELNSIIMHFIEEFIFIWSRRSWPRNNSLVNARLQTRQYWAVLQRAHDLKAIEEITGGLGRIS